MTTTVQEFLKSFDSLSPGEQQEVARALLSRVLDEETSEISDDSLVACAGELLVDLDAREAAIDQSIEINAAIQAGLQAIEEGRCRPYEESMAEFRAKHNLEPPQ
jgi:hypothetical protein